MIDPEPYEAALQNTEAGLAKAKADIANAEAVLARSLAEFDRGIKLQQSKSLSVEDFDSRKAAKDGAVADLLSKKALLLAAEAAPRKVKFDRNNCTIRSEVKGAGRISRTLLTKGNLVTAGQTMLCPKSRPSIQSMRLGFGRKYFIDVPTDLHKQRIGRSKSRNFEVLDRPEERNRLPTRGEGRLHGSRNPSRQRHS